MTTRMMLILSASRKGLIRKTKTRTRIPRSRLSIFIILLLYPDSPRKGKGERSEGGQGALENKAVRRKSQFREIGEGEEGGFGGVVAS